MSDHPVTRWEQADHSGYGQLFAQLVADGTDVDGEARLADVLVPRRATVLDAGSGMGRVADGLVRRGHEVTAVEKDLGLVAQSRSTFPDVAVAQSDLLGLTPAFSGGPRAPGRRLRRGRRGGRARGGRAVRQLRHAHLCRRRLRRVGAQRSNSARSTGIQSVNRSAR